MSYLLFDVVDEASQPFDPVPQSVLAGLSGPDDLERLVESDDGRLGVLELDGQVLLPLDDDQQVLVKPAHQLLHPADQNVLISLAPARAIYF